MRRILTLLAVAVLAAADQLIKMAVKTSLLTGKVIRLGDIIAFRYVENTGMAFSLLSERTVLLSVVTALMLIVLLTLLLSGKVKDKILCASLILVVAGGVGNLCDRIFRGYVIDYIEPLFVDFAVFNFADCLITVGAFGMIAYVILDIVREKRRKEQNS